MSGKKHKLWDYFNLMVKQIGYKKMHSQTSLTLSVSNHNRFR